MQKTKKHLSKKHLSAKTLGWTDSLLDQGIRLPQVEFWMCVGLVDQGIRLPQVEFWVCVATSLVPLWASGLSAPLVVM